MQAVNSAMLLQYLFLTDNLQWPPVLMIFANYLYRCHTLYFRLLFINVTLEISKQPRRNMRKQETMKHLIRKRTKKKTPIKISKKGNLNI